MSSLHNRKLHLSVSDHLRLRTWFHLLLGLHGKAALPRETVALPLADDPATENPTVWQKNGGVYFGHQCEPPENPDRPLDGIWPATAGEHLYRGENHIVAIGPPGTGKTRRLFLPNIARLRDWSLVIVDPKGTVCAHTAVERANRDESGRIIGDNIIVCDPFGVMGQNYPRLVEKYPFLRSRSHNPLAALNVKDPEFVDECQRIAEAIIKIAEQGDRHWSASAQTVGSGLKMGVAISTPGASLGTIRQLIGLAPDEFGKACSIILGAVGDREPAVAARLSRFLKISADDREALSILSTARTQTAWLDSKPIRAALSGEALDFAALKKQPMTVYLILPPKYLATHGSWLRLMITSILSPLLQSVRDCRVPVMFMLDEFAHLGHMAVIHDNIALMREYGVKLWTVWQHLGQAEEIYGKQFEDFIATAGVVQSFAARDVTTREYLSKLSGQRIYWLRTGGTSRTTNTGNDAGVSFGENEGLAHMQGPEFWPHDLGRIAPGQAVLFALEKGALLRSVLPQPEKLVASAAMMAAARRDIEGS